MRFAVLRRVVKDRLSEFVMLGVLVMMGAGCERSSLSNSQPNELNLSAQDAYMLAIAPGQTRAAVYLTLTNQSSEARSINLVSASIAGYAEVHNHIHEDGIMKMRKVVHPSIAANSTLAFNSGGYHIMLFDVAEAPKVGSQFELEMEFDRAESLKIMVEVRPTH